ncbi:MAG: sodium:proton antiporter NhaD [Gammaproteobacteria bacterium]|nr:sodium:proton antiporter NhaD [Gammaproteobacteria bacterium]
MIPSRIPRWLAAATAAGVLPSPVLAAGGAAPDFTITGIGLAALVVFLVAYAFVIAEEFTHLRKSKAMVVAAGVIWVLVAIAYEHAGMPGAGDLLRHDLEGYGELLLFLLSAMTFVNTLQERNIFGALRDWLIARRFSLRALFWITGGLAFFLSPVLDNMTTALVMGAVVIAVGAGYPRFILLACTNIVVAANAGGAFSPFGDITTLMVWQAGKMRFEEFFALFLPAAANWLVPALAMTFAVPRAAPLAAGPRSTVKPGGFVVAALFGLTVTMTVAGHNFLHLPPALGMMTGLGLLSIYGYVIRRGELNGSTEVTNPLPAVPAGFKPATRPFDIFISLKRVEWDTLMFFYGVVISVGGLGALGYLQLLAAATYADLGPFVANVLVGIASAVVDNIPIMFAVLSMDPAMSDGHWLLVTLTAGVGGSLLSIGSAAGVALMGQARGIYTFFGHLRWSWAIALGYVASVWVHRVVNAALF